MDTQLQLFQFDNQEIRTVLVAGEVWWVAKDVCDCLGIKNNRDAVTNLSDHQKDVVVLRDTIGREQKMTTVSESGLYKLVFRSRKPEAECFTDWVVDEVLPSIRKTGSYTLDLGGHRSDRVRVQQIMVAPEECMGCHRVHMDGFRRSRYYRGYLCADCNYALFKHVNHEGEIVVEPSQAQYEGWIASHKGERRLKGLKPWIQDAIAKGFVVTNTEKRYVVITKDGKHAVSATEV